MGMTGNNSGMVLRALPVAVVLAFLPCLLVSSVRAYDGSLSSKVLVSGLQGPAGMAVRADTGDIYVAEKKAGRISVIKGSSASPIITTNWGMDKTLIPLWLVNRDLTKEALSRTALNTPGGVAVTTNGTIYVCESVPGGRLIEFVPDAAGAYTNGQIIPVPWIDRPFTWTDVKVAGDGRLFLAGSVAEADVLHFGSVLMRDAKGDWWVLDFGPFMNYSGVCLSRGEDIAVIAERDRGGLAWWDCVRRIPIGTREESGSGISADAITLLPNGAFVSGQNLAAGGARVLEVPKTGEPKILVGGLDRVSGLLQVSNSLYIADGGKGVIVEAAVPAVGGYMLQRTVGDIEDNEGFKPRQAKKFLDKVLNPSAQTVATDRLAMSLSMQESIDKIALLAGRIVANSPEDAEGSVSEDPLTRLDFVIFFPGKSIDSGDMATPSLAYFSATRKSGKVEQTRELFTGLNIAQRKSGDVWEDGGNSGRILLPVSSVGLEKNENGVNLNLAFLGLGIFSDYYLRLNSGQQNTGEIVVEAPDGTKEVYLAAFTDVATAMSSAESSDQGELMAVAMDPERDAGSMGWLNIGKSPVNVAVGVGMTEMHEFRSMDLKVSTMIQQKDREMEANRPEVTAEDAVPPAGSEGAVKGEPEATESKADGAAAAEPASAEGQKP